MASIKLSNAISQISGGIAGNSYTGNSTSATVRQKVSRCRKSSQRLQQARSRMSQMSKKWAAITQAQRNLWIHDNQYDLTGYDLYKSINSNRLLMNQPFTATPPVAQSKPYIHAIVSSVIPSINRIQISIIMTPAIATARAMIFISCPFSSSCKQSKPRYRYQFSTGVNNGTSFFATALYTTVWGFRQRVGQSVYIRIKFVHTTRYYTIFEWGTKVAYV